MYCLLLALQRHYATLQAVALDQDEDNLPEIKDDTLPDVDGIAKYVMLPLNDVLGLLEFPLCYSVFHNMQIKNSNVLSFSGGLIGIDNAGRIPMQRLSKMLSMGRIMMKMKLKLLLQKPGAVLQHRNAKQLPTWLSQRPRSTIGHNLRTLERCTLFVCIQDLNSRVDWFQAFQLS